MIRLALPLLALLLAGCNFITVEAPDRYALVYGVEDYGGSGNNDLPGAANDARDMAPLLKDLGFNTDFEDEFGTDPGYRIDGRATAVDIRNDIEALAAVAQPGDIVLFYYAGHGGGVETYYDFLDESMEESHIIPSTTDISDTSTWLTKSDMDQLFAKFPSGVQVVAIIDACNSGGLFELSGPELDGLPTDYSTSAQEFEGSEVELTFGNLLVAYGSSSPTSGRSVHYISAAGTNEESMEIARGFFGENPSGENAGVFTYFLRKAMASSSTDRNGDRLVTLDELYSSVFADLHRIWNTELVSEQGFGSRAQFLPHRSGGSMDLVLYQL